MMSAPLSQFLQGLESSGFVLEKGSVHREWIKYMYIFVDKCVTPLLTQDGTASTRRIVMNVIKTLRKEDTEFEHSLPVKKRPIRINKAILCKKPVQSLLTNKDYSPTDVGKVKCVENPDLNYNSMSMDFTGEALIDEEARFLIGVLSNAGPVKKHLYISDATESAMCHMLAPDPQYLDSVVLIPNWRLIPPARKVLKQFKGYIEVLGDPVILLQQTPKISSLVKLPKVPVCSISGVVTNVSSCVSLNRLYYIIHVRTVEEGGSFHKAVCIGQQEWAFWASCVHKGCDVVIHGLYKGKIESKGSFCSYPVLCTTAKSELVKTKSLVTNGSCMSRLQLFRSMAPKLNDISLHEDFCHRVCMPWYIGEITEVITEELALYSLDYGKVTLHGLFLFGEDFGRGLREGAIISVSSAHFYKNDDGLFHLICCARSNIKVIKHSTKSSHWKPSGPSGLAHMTAYLVKGKHLHHPRRFLSLLELLNKLCQNFPFLKRRRLILGGRDFVVLKHLIFPKEETNFVNAGEKRGKRDLTEEIVGSPHTCIFTRSLEKPKDCYHLTNVKELKNRSLTIAEAKYSKKPREDFWMSVIVGEEEIKPSDQKDWNTNLFLLGCVSCDNKTGRLKIGDSSGSIECVILPDGDSAMNSDLTSLCTKDSGCLVHVTKFLVIVECTLKFSGPTTVTCSVDIPSTSEMLENVTASGDIVKHPYIVCSFCDLTVLKRMHRNAEDCHSRLGCRSNSFLKQESGSSSDVIEPPIKRLKVEESSVTSGCINLHVFLTDLFSCRGLTVEGFLLKNGSMIHEFYFPMIRLCFNESLKWKPFLKPGILLRITIPSLIFEKLNSCVDITEECDVEHCHQHVKELPQSIIKLANSKYEKKNSKKPLNKVYSVSELIKNPSYQQTTVKGIIRKRVSYIENDKLCQRLEISDQLTSDTVCLYLGEVTDSPRMSGLIPGAIILIRKMKFRVSERGNVYAKLEEDMSISILSLQQDPMNSSDIVSKQTELCEGSGNKSSHSYKLDQIPDVETNFSILSCSCLSTVYLDQNSNLDKRQLLKVDLFPVKILNVDITVQSDKDRIDDSVISFSAKCLADDHTGHIVLFFNTKTMEEFFNFIDVPVVDRQKFLQLCGSSKMTNIKYSSAIHDGDNIVSGQMKLNEPKSIGLNALICICNNVDSTAVYSREVVVRRKIFPGNSAEGNPKLLTTGTVGVGSQEFHRMKSFNLKLLHFDCVKVL